MDGSGGETSPPAPLPQGEGRKTSPPAPLPQGEGRVWNVKGELGGWSAWSGLEEDGYRLGEDAADEAGCESGTEVVGGGSDSEEAGGDPFLGVDGGEVGRMPCAPLVGMNLATKWMRRTRL